MNVSKLHSVMPIDHGLIEGLYGACYANQPDLVEHYLSKRRFNVSPIQDIF